MNNKHTTYDIKIDNIDELRIWDILQDMGYDYILPKQLMSLNYTTIGVTSETPKYDIGGIKKCAEYTYDDVLIVDKKFEYGNDGVTITFNWYKYDGTVGCSKTEFKPLNIVELADINRKNRTRVITYLQASAIDTPIESYVNALLKHYKTEVDLYIYNNTNDFENAVNNETDPLYLQYLGIIVRPPSDKYPSGKRVKDSILENITI